MQKFLERLRSIKLPLPRNLRLPRLGARQAVLWGAAVAVSVFLFFFIQNLTSCWQVTELPGMRPTSCPGAASAIATPSVNAQGTEIAPPPAPVEAAAPEIQYPQWDGGSRINIVFFGLRGGETAGEDCPLCTDTIIVFTIDPQTRTAGMMSVPRDMFVNIPGFGFSRINTAWTSGEAAKLPGGGPALAMKTVSQFLGVPIQYYAQVDFDTFVKVVDLLGGIDIYNDEDLKLQKLGGGRDTIHITCCGLRHLGGPAALAYARCRDAEQGCTDGDVGRSKRQQKVIIAIRNKIVDPSRFPELMRQAPQLYNTLSAGIRTNMSLDDALKLAVLAKDIPIKKIKQGIIGDQMVNYGNVTLGGQNASILMPIPDKIEELRDKVFGVGASSMPFAQGTPDQLMQADGARVRVVNNSSVPGLDQRTGNYLVAHQMQVTQLGAPTGYSAQTVVIVYAPKLYALRFLMNPLGMITTNSQIIFKPDASQPVDIEIRLGDDWVSRLQALGG